MTQHIIKRFLSKVEKQPIGDRCWFWTGKGRCGKKGLYGQFWLKGKNISAHRASYILFKGEPDKLHVLHRCDNPICVNPEHLFLGTNRDNIADKMSKGRWKGGRPNFIPFSCKRCGKLRQIVKEVCRSCYTTIRRQQRIYIR